MRVFLVHVAKGGGGGVGLVFGVGDGLEGGRWQTRM